MTKTPEIGQALRLDEVQRGMTIAIPGEEDYRDGRFSVDHIERARSYQAIPRPMIRVADLFCREVTRPADTTVTLLGYFNPEN